MKLMSRVAKNDVKDFLIKSVSDDIDIYHVIDAGEQKKLDRPVKFKDMICPNCFNDKGFYIPHGQTWSCLEGGCIQKSYEINKQNLNKSVDIQELNNVSLKPDFLLECIQSKELLEDVRRYIIKSKGFSVIYGPNGTGKTFLSTRMLANYLYPIKDKYFAVLSDINHQWQKDFQDFGSTLYLAERLMDFKALVIDDLAIRKPTEAFMDFLFLVLDKRYRNRSVTIFTTNKPMVEIDNLFGGAISSRIFSEVIFELDGENRHFWEKS